MLEADRLERIARLRWYGSTGAFSPPRRRAPAAPTVRQPINPLQPPPTIAPPTLDGGPSGGTLGGTPTDFTVPFPMSLT